MKREAGDVPNATIVRKSVGKTTECDCFVVYATKLRQLFGETVANQPRPAQGRRQEKAILARRAKGPGLKRLRKRLFWRYEQKARG